MPKDLQYDEDDLDMLDLNSDTKDKNSDNSKSDSNDAESFDEFEVTNPRKLSKKGNGKEKINSEFNSKNKNNQTNEFSNSKNDLIGKNKLENGSDDLTNENDDDSKFFVVRVAGGQESMIASMLQTRLTTKKIEGIYSVLFLENFKGYVIVEALDSNIAYEALHGIRHIRGQIRGELPFKDLEGYLIKKPVVTELTIDDTVEIIAGPFKSMKAKITRVDYEKQEATVVLLDSPYQIPVTVDANYLKKSL